MKSVTIRERETVTIWDDSGLVSVVLEVAHIGNRQARLKVGFGSVALSGPPIEDGTAGDEPAPQAQILDRFDGESVD